MSNICLPLCIVASQQGRAVPSTKMGKPQRATEDRASWDCPWCACRNVCPSAVHVAPVRALLHSALLEQDAGKKQAREHCLQQCYMNLNAFSVMKPCGSAETWQGVAKHKAHAICQTSKKYEVCDARTSLPLKAIISRELADFSTALCKNCKLQPLFPCQFSSFLFFKEICTPNAAFLNYAHLPPPYQHAIRILTGSHIILTFWQSD